MVKLHNIKILFQLQKCKQKTKKDLELQHKISFYIQDKIKLKK